jgi:hypothetical protein
LKLFSSYLPSGFALALFLFLTHVDIANALLDDRNITIKTSLEIASKRQALINFIWGTAGFPISKLPSSVEKNVPSPVWKLDNLERVDTLHITMDAGQSGLAHYFIPKQKNNRLVVLHHGHACTFNDGADSKNRDFGMYRTLNKLLSAGFSVLAVYMPLYTPQYAQKCNQNHDQMLNIATTGSPMKFFLEPVAVSLNYLKSNYQYQDVSMVGLSGGAWTTTIYAAIDPSIKYSFPVAGSVPLYLRYEGYGHDLEQYLPNFYGIAGYPDLYVLGSYGSNRKQIQILNRLDECCFGEKQHKVSGVSFESAVRDYESKVKSTLKNLNSGVFRLYIDEAAPNHMISDNAIVNVIIPVLNGAAIADSWPSSVQGTWSVVANQSTGTLSITQSTTPLNCKAISGSIFGGPIQGFYCPSTGRIVFVRKNSNGITVQYYQGNLSQTGSTLRIGGSFSSLDASFGEYSFYATK